MLYHVELIYETNEYYRVEATSEEDAKEKVLENAVEAYNWDQSLQGIEVEPVN